jgi:hypothetical protein
MAIPRHPAQPAANPYNSVSCPIQEQSDGKFRLVVRYISLPVRADLPKRATPGSRLVSMPQKARESSAKICLSMAAQTAMACPTSWLLFTGSNQIISDVTILRRTAFRLAVPTRNREQWCLNGGEKGIRTPDTGLNPYNGLANRRLQPLGHLSASLA